MFWNEQLWVFFVEYLDHLLSDQVLDFINLLWALCLAGLCFIAYRQASSLGKDLNLQFVRVMFGIRRGWMRHYWSYGNTNYKYCPSCSIWHWEANTKVKTKENPLFCSMSSSILLIKTPLVLCQRAIWELRWETRKTPDDSFTCLCLQKLWQSPGKSWIFTATENRICTLLFQYLPQGIISYSWGKGQERSRQSPWDTCVKNRNWKKRNDAQVS